MGLTFLVESPDVFIQMTSATNRRNLSSGKHSLGSYEVVRDLNHTQPAAVRDLNHTQPAAVGDLNHTQPAAVRDLNHTQPAAVRDLNHTQPAAVRDLNHTQPAAQQSSRGYASQGSQVYVQVMVQH